MNVEIGFLALQRFGFGARPGDLAKIAADPRGSLKAELAKPDVALIALDAPGNADLMGSTAALQGHFAAEAQRKLMRDALAAPSAAMPAPAPALGGGAMEGAAKLNSQSVPRSDEPRFEINTFHAEARAKAQKILDADAGFVERLVHFWSNHFSVSVTKSPIIRTAVGAFEREAIRPHVLGSFADMLIAVTRHPVMLTYLDNQQSVGPNSKAGKNRSRGLNENLGREILELHTLGVDTGYGQADVVALANMITGWTMAGQGGQLGEPGAFVFNANAHEPGAQSLLGKTYPAGGLGQGEAALADLARHPATARHIAFKLARHFVADEPPPALVARLAANFTAHDGDLRALALALIDAPETWEAPLTKLRSPFEFVLAMRRATLRQPLTVARPILGPLSALGQLLWQPPGPNGFPDTAAAWASPEGVKLRLDVADNISRQIKDIDNPSDLLREIIGEAASEETRQAVARAASRAEGIALVFLSPEFQRR